MKKAVCFLVCLSAILLSLSGCQNTEEDTFENIAEETIEDIIGKKIENTQKIFMMSNGSSTARVNSEEAIKPLENLFNEAKYCKIDNLGFSLHIDIDFYSKEGKIQVRVYDDDHIRINGDIYLKSKEISYEKVHSMFIDYVLRNREGKY